MAKDRVYPQGSQIKAGVAAGTLSGESLYSLGRRSLALR